MKSGAWNVVNRSFWKPEALRNWGVAVFDRVSEEKVQRFVTTLVTNLQKLGEHLHRIAPSPAHAE